jgi:exonuclease VII small subunit
MTDKEMTFKEAYLELRKIYEYLSKEEVVDIDEMIRLQKRALELYQFCKSKIKESEDIIEE